MLFFNRQRRVRIVASHYAPFVSRLARAIRRHEDDFCVTLVSDATIRSLNRRFRKKDHSTDVLSFPNQSRPFRLKAAEALDPSLGEIIISAPTARAQARREGHSVEEEIKLLIIHGVLHLMGFDHETDQGEMNRKEYRLRERLL